MFLSLSQLYLEYGASSKEQSVEFSIERMQIDNSLYNTPYPILVYPLPAKGRKCLGTLVCVSQACCVHTDQ